jgi:AraC-like DNA-binding protein
VTSRPAATQRLRDLARLRRVRDRIDREHAQPLDVEALARGVHMAVGCSSLGTFSTRFTELVGVPPSVYRRRAARATAGMPPCVAKQVTRPIRNREARVPEPQLA